MLSQVSTKLLKVHPKNQEYYSDLPEEKYQELKKSIETHGIRDPLKILPDYTIVAGHQRLRIARELEIEKVPVIVLDITPEEAEYLIVTNNTDIEHLREAMERLEASEALEEILTKMEE